MNYITIDVFNSSYSIKTDYDSKYVNKLASFVDRRMREIYDKSTTASTQKVAVLSSITIADDMFKIKKGDNPFAADVYDRVSDLIKMIDLALESD